MRAMRACAWNASSCARSTRPAPSPDTQGAETDRLDHNLIPLTISRGDFSAIKITVARRGVDFHRVVVHFANGGDQEVAMRLTIPAGGETRAIDLRAGERVIRSVEFWFDARSIRGRRAIVRLYGLP